MPPAPGHRLRAPPRAAAAPDQLCTMILTWSDARNSSSSHLAGVMDGGQELLERYRETAAPAIEGALVNHFDSLGRVRRHLLLHSGINFVLSNEQSTTMCRTTD